MVKSVAEIIDDERSAVRRLSHIRPHEVSLVDTAANGRQFLIIKRKGDDMAKKDEGLFKNVVGASATAAGAKPDGAAAGTATTEGTAAAAATTEATVTKRAEIFKGLKAKATEKKVDIAKAVAPEQFDMFGLMADVMDSFSFNLDLMADDLKAFVESGGTTGFMGEAITKSLGGPEAAKMILEEGMSDGMFGSLLALVAKKGAKMKGARLEKLKTLVVDLQDLLKDLEPVTKAAPVAAAAAVVVTPVAEPLSEAKVQELVNGAVTKSRDSMKTEHDAVVKGLQDQITKLAAAPVAPAGEGANGTEEPVVTNKNQGKKSLWANVL